MWVFMEYMDRSLDKLIELVYRTLAQTIPDKALLRIAYSVSSFSCDCKCLICSEGQVFLFHRLLVLYTI